MPWTSASPERCAAVAGPASSERDDHRGLDQAVERAVLGRRRPGLEHGRRAAGVRRRRSARAARSSGRRRVAGEVGPEASPRWPSGASRRSWSRRRPAAQRQHQAVLEQRRQLAAARPWRCRGAAPARQAQAAVVEDPRAPTTVVSRHRSITRRRRAASSPYETNLSGAGACPSEHRMLPGRRAQPTAHARRRSRCRDRT